MNKEELYFTGEDTYLWNVQRLSDPQRPIGIIYWSSARDEIVFAPFKPCYKHFANNVDIIGKITDLQKKHNDERRAIFDTF